MIARLLHASGFTLVELLVVIAIIGILVLLLPAAAGEIGASRACGQLAVIPAVGHRMAGVVRNNRRQGTNLNDASVSPTGSSDPAISRKCPFTPDRPQTERLPRQGCPFATRRSACGLSLRAAGGVFDYAACHHDVEAGSTQL
jgi:prepilin-type N-terminal cleavage/methylation domain-containing protein